MRKKFAAAIVATLLAAGAWNSSNAQGIAAGGGIGTLGLGVDASYAINDMLWIRGNANFGGFDLPEFMTSASTYGGINYDFEAQFQTVGLLADFFPLGSGVGLSFTAGVYHNANEFALVTTPTASITIGGLTYTPADIGTLRAEATFREFSPYLGAGYNGNVFLGVPIELYARAGVLFQGSPSISMTATGGLVSAGDLSAEEQELEDSLANLELYPVLAFGAMIRF